MGEKGGSAYPVLLGLGWSRWSGVAAGRVAEVNGGEVREVHTLDVSLSEALTGRPDEGLILDGLVVARVLTQEDHGWTPSGEGV